MSAPRIHGAVGNAAALRRLIAAHEAAGGYWFTAGTMSYFGSRLETGLLHGDRFITSEQRPAGPYDDEEPPRLFTIRRFTPDDVYLVSTVGDFQQYPTLDAALTAATNL